MKKFLLFVIVFCTAFFGLIYTAKATTVHDNLPTIYFKAINPGYTQDGQSNVGEFIEIANNSDQPYSLAGATVGYTNSSGNTSILYEFPEHSWVTGESILLLRLAGSPGSELATITYSKTLAMKGGLSLLNGEETIDSVCWTSKDGCVSEFKSSSPTTLVRNLETSEFEHQTEYVPIYDEKSYYVEKITEEKSFSQCKGLVFSEILSYYDNSRTEQFIEFYNSTPEQILLDGCQIRYKNKLYPLSGIIKPEEYIAYFPVFSLTKNPTTNNLLELIDTDATVVDNLRYPNGQRKGTSYAFIGFDQNGQELWRVTYAPTPGTPNHYQEFKTCEEGKVINPETGNCVKTTSVKEKICPAGQFLNLLTGRCKKNDTATTKICKEGYYLNPETNRCRKIKENTGASFEVTPENYEESSSFIALYAVFGIVVLGIIYLIYEFRTEIAKLLRRVFRRDH